MGADDLATENSFVLSETGGNNKVLSCYVDYKKISFYKKGSHISLNNWKLKEIIVRLNQNIF